MHQERLKNFHCNETRTYKIFENISNRYILILMLFPLHDLHHCDSYNSNIASLALDVHTPPVLGFVLNLMITSFLYQLIAKLHVDSRVP